MTPPTSVTRPILYPEPSGFSVAASVSFTSSSFAASSFAALSVFVVSSALVSAVSPEPPQAVSEAAIAAANISATVFFFINLSPFKLYVLRLL